MKAFKMLTAAEYVKRVRLGHKTGWDGMGLAGSLGEQTPSHSSVYVLFNHHHLVSPAQTAAAI